ncbi:CotH kinase family protein [Hahella ganghwensis]|uniref:CotH kinase family protein n=1 Tax=Hahella ganghwensis TaxID=286420 RepID=UPI00036FE0A3|nr:CotH kinase family protein [Hahella ganghwensis]
MIKITKTPGHTHNPPICLTMILLGVLSWQMVGCSGGTSTATKPSDFDTPLEPVNVGGDGDLYDANRLLNVSISLPEADYAAMKAEGRTLASTARECVPEYEYTEFKATVTIDGDTMENVVIRKKGFLGSLSPSRPSIKLDFNDLHDGRTYQNMTRMTLNNNRQDPSNARQCMAYDKFRAIGIAAPRCNFARVSVNGEDLGIFSNVEPVKKPFLKRTFGDDDGNLYEAQLADFGTYLSDNFEKKTNKKENDRTDLMSVTDALQLPDTQLAAVLPQLIDVDEFIDFWAMETLLGFWDSATGNANNYYIYRSPDDGLFHFIPWGADTAFVGTHLFKPDSGPMYRNLSIAKRLYDIDIYRDQYHSTLESLLENHWNEEELQSELNRIRQLTGTSESSFETINQFIFGRGVEGEDNHIASQRQRLAAALSGDETPGNSHVLQDVAANCSDNPITTELTADITSTDGTDKGVFRFTLPNGNNVAASLTYAAFKVDSLVYSLADFTSPSVVSLLLIGADINDNFTPYVIQLYIEVSDYKPGTHALHGLATNLLLFEVDESAPLGINTIAMGRQAASPSTA